MSAIVSDDVQVEWAREASPAPSFDDCYDRLLERAYFVGWRFFRDRSDAQDVAQEALTRAYARWRQVRRHDSPDAWVVRTAVNVCLELRRKRPPFRPSADDPRRLPASPAADDEVALTQVLAAAVKKRSQRQRYVVVWRYVFDASVQETGDQLGMTESQVKDATHEAVKKLRRILGDQGPWAS